MRNCLLFSYITMLNEKNLCHRSYLNTLKLIQYSPQSLRWDDEIEYNAFSSDAGCKGCYGGCMQDVSSTGECWVCNDWSTFFFSGAAGASRNLIYPMVAACTELFHENWHLEITILSSCWVKYHFQVLSEYIMIMKLVSVCISQLSGMSWQLWVPCQWPLIHQPFSLSRCTYVHNVHASVLMSICVHVCRLVELTDKVRELKWGFVQVTLFRVKTWWLGTV